MTKKITIIWGSDRDPNNKETYKFKTKEQLKYFMMGVDEAEGWLEYQIVSLGATGSSPVIRPISKLL